MGATRRTIKDRLRDGLAAFKASLTGRHDEGRRRVPDESTDRAVDPSRTGTGAAPSKAGDIAGEVAALTRCALEAAAAALEDVQPPTGSALRLDMALVDETALLLGLPDRDSVALRAALLLTRLRADARLRIETPEAVTG